MSYTVPFGHYFTLRDHCPVDCDDLAEWGRWMQAADRRVARTQVGDADVSTVFLGINHAFDNGEPILFETMIFGGERDGDGQRYHTWEQAEAGHAKFVAELTAAATKMTT